MAMVSILAGGLVGFFSALVSLIALNVSWLTALGLWAGIGVFAGFAVLFWAMAPRRKQRPTQATRSRAEHA